MKLIACIPILLIVSFMWSCESNEAKGINSDIVNNPATASGKKQSDRIPEITFKNDLYDFGSIVQGEIVTHSYKFTNTGKADLVISMATGSCGCTIPQWPTQPIAPGEEASIVVKFDSKNKDGKQHKTITITANTLPSTSVVALSGEVIAPKK